MVPVCWPSTGGGVGDATLITPPLFPWGPVAGTRPVSPRRLQTHATFLSQMQTLGDQAPPLRAEGSGAGGRPAQSSHPPCLHPPQGSSDFCVDPDTYVTRMVEERSVLSGGESAVVSQQSQPHVSASCCLQGHRPSGSGLALAPLTGGESQAWGFLMFPT